MIDRASLRMSAGLLLAGQLLYILVTQFHAGGAANDHPAIFTVYAGSAVWKAVHVGQFVSAAILLAGLLVLPFAVSGHGERRRWFGRFGAALAVVALALYGVLQAVDGVGNKEVDDAWVNAPDAEKAARFASAEAMRWLEWGARSYHDFALGIALLLIAAAIVGAVGVPRPIAYLMGLSGLTYLVQGWVVGSEGFSETHTILILVAWALTLAWMIWLVVVAWRLPDSGASRTH
ncbi:MAG: hypothetical protein ACJ72M_02080 [Propionibacteriaceae bacterium]|jgi:hypothetical protein